MAGSKNAFYGRKHTAATRLALSLAAKKRYRENPEYRRLAALAGAKGYTHRGIKPTSIEARVARVIEKHHLNYRYTGDGKMWILNRNPDFANSNGAKILIEVAGNHWHTPVEMADRCAHFARFGFRTLVIWENELREMTDNEVADIVRRFEAESISGQSGTEGTI